MDKSFNPLTGEVPEEVPLKDAPLVRVIGQVRFPDIEIVNETQGIVPLQQQIKAKFPILKSERVEALQFTPEGPKQAGPPKYIRRFSSADENSRLSLAPDFLAYETTQYISRSHFIGELMELYSIANEVIGIPLITRVGIRYIDRILLGETVQITELIRSETLGILGTELGDSAHLAIQDNIFRMPHLNAEMRARWGIVPPGATIDPAAIEPIQESAWLLDIDTFSTSKQTFSDVELSERFGQLAERSYAMFRWVVSDKFLKQFGGDV